MSAFVQLGLAVVAAMLVGCKVEVGAGGIGGNIDPRDPNVEYFEPDESEFKFQREENTKLPENGSNLESADDECRSQATVAEPAGRLTPPCGSPSAVVQRAVALVKYPVFNPVSFGTGGDGRASRREHQRTQSSRC